MITQSKLLELFDYCDGQLIRKKNLGKFKKGTPAGTLRLDGYSQIHLNYKIYKTHQLIFLFHHGYIPPIIDHIDRNPLNNKIENLREVTATQNCANTKKNKNNKSGYRGVSWNKIAKKWAAHISINKKKKYLGFFKTAEIAYEAYCTEAKKHFGEFVNL